MNSVPTWVYVLFFVLLYLGIKRCYTRVISVQRIMIAPVFFILLSLRSATTSFHFSTVGFGLLILGSIFGMFIGHFHIKNLMIRSDKRKHLIEIPGDISMLLMVMAIFFIEFFVHYAIDANWGFAQYNSFRNLAMCLSGIIVGISVGRAVTYVVKYKNTESVDLIKS